MAAIALFSRRGRSQGLLYRQRCHEVIHSHIDDPLCPLALQRPKRLEMVVHKIEYVAQTWGILQGYQNCTVD